VCSADDEAEYADVVRRDAVGDAESQSIDRRIVLGKALEGSDGKTARPMRIDTGNDRRSLVREIPWRVPGIDHAPQVRLEVTAGFADDLVGDARYFVAPKQPAHHAVVGAVRGALLQGDRQGHARPATIFGRLPGLAREQHDLPVRMAAALDTCYQRDHVAPPLHEVELELRQVTQRLADVAAAVQGIVDCPEAGCTLDAHQPQRA
jgi:hypothetical protein